MEWNAVVGIDERERERERGLNTILIQLTHLVCLIVI